MQLVTRLPEEWHYVGLISLEHANANFPNELHNYQKFLHHCRCVFSHSSLYFFSASELLSARTQTIQFLFISPLHSSSSPTPATQHLPRLPHPPSHLSLFTPLRISPLAIKTHSSPCCRPNSPPRCLFPFLILASTSLSPPFGFN